MENIKKLKDIEKGDVFAYKIENDEEFKGRYLILWETGLYDDKCSTSRFMRIKITKDSNLPKNLDEFQKLEDIITTITFLEARFFPFNLNDTIDNQIAEKSKVEVEPDEFDYLYSYTIGIIHFSTLYKNLIYLGNFEINMNMKPKEFLPFCLANLNHAIAKKNNLKLFEDACLRHYKMYNLRRCELWNYTQKQRNERKKETDIIIEAGKKARKKLEGKMTVLELLINTINKDKVLPISIRVDEIEYQIDMLTDSYIRKEKGGYRELTHDLSLKMPPRDWLLLKVEIISDEEYEKSLEK